LNGKFQRVRLAWNEKKSGKKTKAAKMMRLGSRNR
jgi:hypothetical protein